MSDSDSLPEFFPGDDEAGWPWEDDARQAVERAVANVELDEVRGSVYLMSGTDHRWNTVQEEFRDYESAFTRLLNIGENAWLESVPYESGSPVFESDVESLVESALNESGIDEFFASISPPQEGGDELIKASDLLAKGAGLPVQIDVAEINAELIRNLASHPEKMRELNPRKFEELVAELFRAKGYEVVLTPRSKDGGFDISVAQESSLGSFLTLVECKRWDEKKPVGVQIVRGLYGVVTAKNATSGLIATTSFFTKGAKSEQQNISTRMELADFERLKQWLDSYRAQGA